jgi:hypothetical protein
MKPECSLPHSQQPVTCPYPEQDRFSPCPHPSSRRSILILLFHQCLGLTSGILPHVSQPKPCVHLSFPTYMLHALPIAVFLFDHPNNGFLSPQHSASSGCSWRNGLQIWRVAANILNKQSRWATRGGPPFWGFDEMLKNPRLKNLTMLRIIHKSVWIGLIVTGIASLCFYLSFGFWDQFSGPTPQNHVSSS